MRGVKIFLAGEGRTELGDWATLPQYRQTPPKAGVLLALVDSVASTPTMIVGARKWKDLITLRPGGKRGHEQRRVGQLAHFAREAGADVVVFTRDRDHDRAQQIEAGIRDAETEPRPKIVGATAIEAIEAWVLALRGEHESESHSKPKSVLQERHQISTTEQMVDFIRDADLEQIPTDAHSLKQWLAQAKKHLQPGVPQA